MNTCKEVDFWKKWIDCISVNLLLWCCTTAAAKSLQSCPTLCDPIDGSPPGSPVPGIFQARTLEWGAISFSKAWKWKVKVKLLSRVRLLATPWTAAYQAPPSMGFSRQEDWSGVPSPSLMLHYKLYQMLPWRENRYSTITLFYFLLFFNINLFVLFFMQHVNLKMKAFFFKLLQKLEIRKEIFKKC